MPTPAEVAQFAAANASVVDMVHRDLDSFWASLNLDRPEDARDELLEFIPILVAAYGEVAASLAAEWFEELRDEAAMAGVFAAVGALASFRAVAVDPVQSVPPAAVEQTVRWAAGGLFPTNDGTPRAPGMPATPDATLATLRDALQRQVLQPGRDTIVRNTNTDRAARGWGRFVRPGACSFCRMLSGRGGVYTERSAAFNAHDGNCQCVAAPVWDPRAPKVDVRAQFVASARTSAMTEQQREKYRARLNGYLEDVPESAGVTYDPAD